MDFEEFLELIAQSMPIDIGNGTVQGVFDPGIRDRDVYSFTIEEGEIINFAGFGEGRVPLSIFDADGNIVVSRTTIGRGGFSGEPIAIGGVAAGTYYLIADNQNIDGTFFQGDYTIEVTPILNDVSNSRDGAVSIQADGQSVLTSIDYREDVDVFSIDVTRGQMFAFDLSSANSGLLRLTDADGNLLDIMRGDIVTQGSFLDFNYLAGFTGTVFVTVAGINLGNPLQPRLGEVEFSVTDISPPTLNIIDGTEDHDTLFGTSGGDDMAGFGGDDKLFSLGGHDKLFGGDGNDLLHAGAGDDELFGEAGNDRLYGITGDDYLDGGAGHDLLLGGDGQDSLFGGGNNDRLYGGAGDDYLSGGNHNDVLFGEDGDDSLFGDAGADRLLGGQGHDYLSGGTGHDKLFGGAGRDALDGDAGEDILYGQGGADILNGGAGSDNLFGGAGDDYLDGGTGNDVLTGGGGADIFRYQTNGGVDRIVDFDWHQDKVDFSNGLIAFQDFDDLLDHAEQIGENLHLIVGDGNRLVLQDVDLHDIDADMFIFI